MNYFANNKAEAAYLMLFYPRLFLNEGVERIRDRDNYGYYFADKQQCIDILRAARLETDYFNFSDTMNDFVKRSKNATGQVKY